jgi:hypothetical protein
MRTRCTVCQDPRRAEIDADLVRGAGFRSTAAKYGVSRWSLQRHQKHLDRTIIQAHQAGEVLRADSLLSELRGITDRARGLLARAERAGDLRGAANGLRETRACLELLARLSGELRENPVVNLVIAPEWVQLRGRILVAVEPFPEAREAIVRALEADNAP